MNQDKPSQHRKTVLGLRNMNYFLLLTCATIHMHSGWSSLAPNGQFSFRKVKQRPRQKRLHILSSVLDSHCFCVNLDATHAVRRYETLATLTSALVVGVCVEFWSPLLSPSGLVWPLCGTVLTARMHDGVELIQCSNGHNLPHPIVAINFSFPVSMHHSWKFCSECSSILLLCYALAYEENGVVWCDVYWCNSMWFDVMQCGVVCWNTM